MSFFDVPFNDFPPFIQKLFKESLFIDFLSELPEPERFDFDDASDADESQEIYLSVDWKIDGKEITLYIDNAIEDDGTVANDIIQVIQGSVIKAYPDLSNPEFRAHMKNILQPKIK